MHSFNQYKWISGNKQRISFNLRLQRRYLLIWMFIDIEKPLLTGDPRTHLLRRSLTKQFAFLPFKKQNYPPRKAIYVIICQSFPFNVEFNPSSHCQSNSNWNSKIGAISIHLGKHLKFMLKLGQKWRCFYIYLQINLFIYFFAFVYCKLQSCRRAIQTCGLIRLNANKTANWADKKKRKDAVLVETIELYHLIRFYHKKISNGNRTLSFVRCSLLELIQVHQHSISINDISLAIYVLNFNATINTEVMTF